MLPSDINSDINTFTIGLEGSVDIHYARIAAKYFGTNHHEYIISEKDFLERIKMAPNGLWNNYKCTFLY